MTTLLEVDWDIYENDLREEGRIEGEKKGRKAERMEIIFSMYKNGIPIQQIASIIKVDITEIEKILSDK